MTDAERAYYDQRAPEYDDWYRGPGLHSQHRPGWGHELATLQSVIAGLSFNTVLDVACGTAFLRQHLRGRVGALDYSAAMLAIARQRISSGSFVRGNALQLPFAAGSFECIFAAH